MKRRLLFGVIFTDFSSPWQLDNANSAVHSRAPIFLGKREMQDFQLFTSLLFVVNGDVSVQKFSSQWWLQLRVDAVQPLTYDGGVQRACLVN